MSEAAPDPSAPGTGATRAVPPWRRVVGVLLAAVAIAYLAYLVHAQWHTFGDALARLSLTTLALAVLGATAMSALKGLYHEGLLGRLRGDRGAGALVFLAYTRGQVVRYLPGKVWGVVYEAARLAPRFDARSVIVATAIQMLNTNVLSIGVVGSAALAIVLRSPWPLAGIVVALVAVEILHRTPVLERWLMRLAHRWRPHASFDPALSPPPAPWTATAILAAEWLAYCAIWVAIVPDDLQHALTWSIWYASASLLALFALAVPAGIAVREALFVYLGSIAGADTAQLVVFGVLLRIVLTLGELVAVVVAEARIRVAA